MNGSDLSNYAAKQIVLVCVVAVLVSSCVWDAVLYIVNNLEIPLNLFKSYTVYSGANDANVEWWYGHNIVGFIFTVPVLAMFYYFLPKATGLPIYSHRLSIVSFWSMYSMMASICGWV